MSNIASQTVGLGIRRVRPIRQWVGWASSIFVKPRVDQFFEFLHCFFRV